MEQRVLSGDSEYLKSGFAKAFPSNAGSQTGVDPAELDRLSAALQRDGYVILERIVPEEQIDTIREELLTLLPEHCGRNGFEGTLTQRLYAVISKTLACNPLVEHPLVLGLLDRVLAPNYLLSQLQVINILPGELAQPLHHDDGFYPVPRPRPPYGAATVIALDDFTADNGATVVIPAAIPGASTSRTLKTANEPFRRSCLKVQWCCSLAPCGTAAAPITVPRRASR